MYSVMICHYVLCQQVRIRVITHYVPCQQVSVIMYSVNRYLSLCTLSTGIYHQVSVIMYSVSRYLSLCTLTTGICHCVPCQQVTQGDHTRLTWTCDKDSLGGWVPTLITHGIHPRHRLLQVKNCLCSHSYDGDYSCVNYSVYFHTV